MELFAIIGILNILYCDGVAVGINGTLCSCLNRRSDIQDLTHIPVKGEQSQFSLQGQRLGEHFHTY